MWWGVSSVHDIILALTNNEMCELLCDGWWGSEVHALAPGEAKLGFSLVEM